MFNDGWDAMSKEDAVCDGLDPKRTVWSIATQPYKSAH